MSKKSHYLALALLLTLFNLSGIAETITWTGSVNGEWNEPENWDLGRVPINGDVLVFPAEAPNKTQNAIGLGSSSPGEQMSVFIEGGGYLITNSAVSLGFGSTFSSVGDNRIDFRVWHQGSPNYISNDGTLTFGAQHSTKDVKLQGGGDIIFLLRIGGGARAVYFTSSGTVRFQGGLGAFRGTSGSNARGVDIGGSGALLVNDTQTSGNYLFNIGNNGILGGLGHVNATNNPSYAGSGFIGVGYRLNTWASTGNGTIAPGDPLVDDGIGEFTVTVSDWIIFGRDIPATSGTLEIDLAENGATDKLIINGDVDLSSTNSILHLIAPETVTLPQSAAFMEFTGTRTGKFSKILLNGVDITGQSEQSFRIGKDVARLVYDKSTAGNLSLEKPPGTIITNK